MFDDGNAVLGTLISTKPYLYKNNQLKKFTIPHGEGSSIHFVNGNGMFGGTFYDSLSKQQLGFTSDEGGKVTTYSVPGSGYTVVTAVGPHGDVAGFYLAASNYIEGFIYSKKIYNTIAYPNQPSTEITGFSSTGAIVGYFSSFTGNNNSQGYPFIATCASDKGCTH